MKRTFLAVMIFALPFFLTGARPSSAAELTTRIDESVVAVRKLEKVVPAPPTNDSEFLRRTYLDLCGKILSFEEATAFLNDTVADKREKLIDRLLDDPRFAQH